MFIYNTYTISAHLTQIKDELYGDAIFIRVRTRDVAAAATICTREYFGAQYGDNARRRCHAAARQPQLCGATTNGRRGRALNGCVQQFVDSLLSDL